MKGRAPAPSPSVAALLRDPVAAEAMEVRVAWVTTGDEGGDASEGDVCVAICADAEVAKVRWPFTANVQCCIRALW